MKHPIFEKLSSWFDRYTWSFCTGDELLEDAVHLKHAHSCRVVTEMAGLCGSIAASDEQRLLAHIAALFHDVARYEQFRKYRTFSDKKSENHADRAVTIINEFKLFDMLDRSAREAVIEAIRFHNAVEVPEHLTPQQVFLCRMLRDADKLDIYKIALDHYINPDPKRRETVQVGIPDGEIVSREVCTMVLEQKIVPYEMIKTVNDFKMIQLGWIYDLNFTYSLRCVRERGYVDEIVKLLPVTSDVLAVVEAIERYLMSKIGT